MNEAEKHALQIIPEGTSLMKMFWLRLRFFAIFGMIFSVLSYFQPDSRVYPSLVEYHSIPKVKRVKVMIPTLNSEKPIDIFAVYLISYHLSISELVQRKIMISCHLCWQIKFQMITHKAWI